jgi:hypothetical protein
MHTLLPHPLARYQKRAGLLAWRVMYWLAPFEARGQLALRYWRRMITPEIILPGIVSLICLALLPDSNPLAEMKNAASK